MEFGELFFDEEESGESVSAGTSQVQSYQPKLCEQEWFEKTEDVEDVVVKYRADLHYYKKDYLSALHLYKHFLAIIPATHSQLKREVVDSIVRCCIGCGHCQEGLEWCKQLVASPDHSLWQLQAKCHELFKTSNHYRDEVVCRLKCVLLARHFPQYWLELHSAYSRVLTCELDQSSVDAEVLLLTQEVFRPYFNKREVLSSSVACPQFELFVNALTVPPRASVASYEDYLTVLKVALVGSMLRADQLLRYCLSHQFSTLRLSSVQGMMEQTNAFLNNQDCPALKTLIVKYMQTPFEIEI